MKLTAITAMDSREIAERTGKEHAHVCRDIRAMLEELGEPESRFGSGYLDAQGQKRNCYILPKRECLILASGYSVAWNFTYTLLNADGSTTTHEVRS